MRFKIGLAAAAVAVVALGVAIASANQGSVPTQVTIHKQGGGEKPTFHGRVLSNVRGCYDQRRVLLFDEDEDPAEKVGHTFSDSDGHWAFNAYAAWLPSGDYYAAVRHKELSQFRHCEGDRSPSVRYEGSKCWKQKILICDLIKD